MAENASLTRYDIGSDELVPVTQEWVDLAQRQFRAFGLAREAARKALLIVDEGVVKASPALQSFLDAWRPEFEPKPDAR